jgi:hypothetical protein
VSRVEIQNPYRSSVVHLPTSRAGELWLRDRVVTRGKGAKLAVVRSFEAIFTFDDPLICAPSDVPEHGCYFMQEDGNAEVTQLIACFARVEERAPWLKALFGIGPG